MQAISGDNNRQLLLALLQAGLDSVAGRNAVKQYFLNSPVDVEQIALVAIGKASASMAQGVVDIFADKIVSGLIISKSENLDQRLCEVMGLQCIVGAHPVPDESSLVAGKALLSYLAGLPDELPVVFLISGGTSSLLEVLPDNVSLSELQRINQWLLASGLSIDLMNAVRKAVSVIKAGRLAKYLGHRKTLNLLLSDVPGNNPADIGSGLLIKNTTDRLLPEPLPPWLSEIIESVALKNELVEQDFRMIETVIIGDNQTACAAVQHYAREMGLAVTLHLQALSGDAVTMAKHIARVLRDAKAGVHIWGGETTVQLPDSPGRGGRNQHLALALALEIQNDPTVTVVAIGTDGSDGASDDAGALVDGTTIGKGELSGLSAVQCLQQANSGEFLEQTGDLINTGPTGTNVMDLVIACKT